MLENSDDNTKVGWKQKLRHKYRLVILNEQTYEERIAFRLSRLNVFVVLFLLSVILIVGTIFLIAFTPLRGYVPGYMDVNLQRELYEVQLLADSMQREMNVRDVYLANLNAIISGQDPDSISDDQHNVKTDNYDTIELTHSRADSLLRKEYDNIAEFNIRSEGVEKYYGHDMLLGYLNFFPPISGVITNGFNAVENHYGVDLVAANNATIKAVLDGTVIFANWTVETGHVIVLQHRGGILSVYKHNAVLLKKQGALVKAGEPIAIVGESGELSTGPHLHFELWMDGKPVDPQIYINY